MSAERSKALALGVSTGWVYEKAASDELPSYKFGGHRRFRVSEVEDWACQHASGRMGRGDETKKKRSVYLMAYGRRRSSAAGPRFDVCWRENGRDRSRTFALRKDADRFRIELERRAQLGALYEAPPITLAAARKSWKERWRIGKPASTVQRKDEAWPMCRRSTRRWPR